MYIYICTRKTERERQKNMEREKDLTTVVEEQLSIFSFKFIFLCEKMKK